MNVIEKLTYSNKDFDNNLARQAKQAKIFFSFTVTLGLLGVKSLPSTQDISSFSGYA